MPDSLTQQRYIRIGKFASASKMLRSPTTPARQFPQFTHHVTKVGSAAGTSASDVTVLPGEQFCCSSAESYKTDHWQTPTSVLQSRRLHNVPELIHERIYKKDGIPEFMSPAAFDFAWTQYQRFILDKLNLLTQGKTISHARLDERF